MYLIIGLYLDIRFTIVKLVQQMANPSNKYYWAGLHLYKYLLNTCKYSIVYDGLSNKSVVVHSNSDWIQDSESCKSVTGYLTHSLKSNILDELLIKNSSPVFNWG